jgi:hypothetical protein
MLRAAFTSRSWSAPQPQVHERTCNGIVAAIAPQTAQSLDDGNERSTVITFRPYQLALYSSTCRNCRHPASLIVRARRTVTVEGAMPSDSGRDQRMSSGSAIFADFSSPSRQRNAERVYSAPARDFFRDLNRGHRARLAKKFANPVCRCRNACCSGTAETSARYASSSVRFQVVSSADVAT